MSFHCIIIQFHFFIIEYYYVLCFLCIVIPFVIISSYYDAYVLETYPPNLGPKTTGLDCLYVFGG